MLRQTLAIGHSGRSTVNICSTDSSSQILCEQWKQEETSKQCPFETHQTMFQVAWLPLLPEKSSPCLIVNPRKLPVQVPFQAPCLEVMSSGAIWRALRMLLSSPAYSSALEFNQIASVTWLPTSRDVSTCVYFWNVTTVCELHPMLWLQVLISR